MSLLPSDATPETSPSAAHLAPTRFVEAFAGFQRLIAANGQGRAFINFREGIAAAWEGYKPRLRGHALRILDTDAWSEGEMGSGAILRRAIAAIEIQDSRANQINNLVFWQNQFGHANRDHRVFLEAMEEPPQRREIERLLFGLYRGDADEGEVFTCLCSLKGATYPLLAYLFFLKDMDRFVPTPAFDLRQGFRSAGY